MQLHLLGRPLDLRSPLGEEVPGSKTIYPLLLIRYPCQDIPSLRPLQEVFPEVALLVVVGGLGSLAEELLAREDLVFRAVACHAARVLPVSKGQ